jgi:hypothetical protein
MPPGSQNYTLRIAALFGILAVSSIGGFLPLVLARRTNLGQLTFLSFCIRFQGNYAPDI